MKILCTTTIEFKKNYRNKGYVSESDLEKLYEEISKALNENIMYRACKL